MRFLKAALRAVPALLRDALGLAGAGMIVFGVWQMHQPSAWIVAGLMLVAAVWRLARRPRPAATEDEAS